MAASIPEDIQALLDQPKGGGMVVSCYADTSVAEGFEPHWLQPLKTEASRVRQTLADDHQARSEFERDMEAIRRALETSVARNARGMAIFSGAGQGFFLALPSSVPYENRLVVAEEPYVVPLLEAYLHERGYLVVLTDSHHARWYAAGPGGSQPLGEIDEAVPKKQHTAGERHRKDHILHFQKELAGRLEEAFGAYPYQGIVLLGDHEILAQLRGQLPPRLGASVVHEAPHAWTPETLAIAAEVQKLLAGVTAGEENRVLGELDRRLLEASAVAAGPQEVIEALRNGQVSALIVGPDPGAAASRCTGCGSLFALAHAKCAYCQAPCRTGNLWQEVLGFAIRHGIWVHRVRSSPTLADHGGIAALLARDEPQWRPGMTTAGVTGTA